MIPLIALFAVGELIPTFSHPANGQLLPRMNRVFRRGDWAANGLLFAGYHVHTPWIIPATLLVDTSAICYPARRYQSAWIGIAAHSAQSLVVGVAVPRSSSESDAGRHTFGQDGSRPSRIARLRNS